MPVIEWQWKAVLASQASDYPLARSTLPEHWLINNLCVLSLEPTFRQQCLACFTEGSLSVYVLPLRARALVMPIIARLLNYCDLRNNDLWPSSRPIRSGINTPVWHSLSLSLFDASSLPCHKSDIDLRQSPHLPFDSYLGASGPVTGLSSCCPFNNCLVRRALPPLRSGRQKGQLTVPGQDLFDSVMHQYQ